MENTTIRLNKYLANQGVAARRDIKQLVKAQNVTVNGKRVTEPGVRIDPQKDIIQLNGRRIMPPKLVYYLLNKPKGIISTTADEYGRKNVLSLIPTKQRIYPVGRLDKDTSGLIILTNDGELTNRLTHPKFHVYKVYRLSIKGRVNKAQLHAFRNGVLLDDGITAPAQIKIITESPTGTLLEVTLHEGKNRQIRRMCETVSMDLVNLQRVKFGPIGMEGLKLGQYRELTDKEIKQLREASNQQGTKNN